MSGAKPQSSRSWSSSDLTAAKAEDVAIKPVLRSDIRFRAAGPAARPGNRQRAGEAGHYVQKEGGSTARWNFNSPRNPPYIPRAQSPKPKAWSREPPQFAAGFPLATNFANSAHGNVRPP